MPEVADRFFGAVEEAMSQLVLMPEMGAPRHFDDAVLARLRAWPVPGFEHIRLFYLVFLGRMTKVKICQ